MQRYRCFSWLCTMGLLAVCWVVPGQGTDAATAANAPADAVVEAGDSEAELTPGTPQWEVMKARRRLEQLQSTRESVQSRVDEGLAVHEDLVAALSALEEASWALAEAEQRAELARALQRKISLSLNNATLEDALRLVFRESPYSYVMDPSLKGGAQVTVELKDAPFIDALGAICAAAGVECRPIDSSVWVITPRRDIIRMGDVEVPVLGALNVQDAGRADTGSRVGVTTRVASGPKPLPQRVSLPHLTLSGRSGHVLVDLAVENAPLDEVADALVRQIDPEATVDSLEIAVDESLKGIRVTAQVYRWPLLDVLAAVIEQAGVAFQVETEDEPVSARDAAGRGPAPRRMGHVRHERLHLIPEPEVHVSGALRSRPDGPLPPIEPSRARPLPGHGPGRPRESMFPGMAQLVDLEVDSMPLAEVMSVLTSQWDAEKENRAIDIVVHDSARDVRVTARVHRWPLGDVVEMLMDAVDLTHTGEYRQDDPYPREIYYLVPRPGLKVIGPGIVPQSTGDRVDWLTDASVEWLKSGKVLDEQAIERLIESGLRHCPNCHNLVLGQDWKFCAHCGAKLPEGAGE